eukprot:gene212-biopygen75
MRMRFGVFHRRVSCQYRIGMAHTNCEATKVASQRIMRLLPDQQRNLVDPASSHMLVSKIKPCMSKYKPLYGETANGSLKQLSSP